MASASAFSINGDSQTSGSLGVENIVKTSLDTNVKTEVNSSKKDDEEDVNGDKEISSEDNVNNNTDLSLFVHTVIKHDKNVSDVEVNDDDVSVEYKTNIKLFGFLPWTTYATVTVNSKGETTIDYPWYAMFASTDEVNLQSQVKTSTRAFVNTEADANTKLSASAKAQVLAKIHAAMKANFEASSK